jgi:hypothetical protein
VTVTHRSRVLHSAWTHTPRRLTVTRPRVGGLSGLEFAGDGPASAMLTGSGGWKDEAAAPPPPPPRGGPPKPAVKGFRATVLVKAKKMPNPLADEDAGKPQVRYSDGRSCES